jgi:predicted neutral ceramidase superfamily lipid hydrolase
MFMLQTIAILPVFVGVVGLIYRRSLGTHILPRIRSFMLARTRAT